MTEILYRDEAYAIVGAAMEVYNQLGSGFLEDVFQEALVIEFSLRQIPFREKPPLQIAYKGQILQKTYIPDFVLYDKIVVELKAIKQLSRIEEAQLMNYLKATGLRLGLLLNFGAEGGLERRRMVC